MITDLRYLKKPGSGIGIGNLEFVLNVIYLRRNKSKLLRLIEK